MALSLVLNGSQWAGWYVICNSEFYFLSATLPKITFSAQPSSVVPTKGNVTLNCWSFPRNVNCNYQRQDTKLDPRTQLGMRKRRFRSLSVSAVLGSFNFHLIEVEESDSGYYTCICYRYENPNVSLWYSDEILILVTGEEGLPQNDMCQSIRKEGSKGWSSSEQLGWAGSDDSDRNEYLVIDFICICVFCTYVICILASVWASMGVDVCTHTCVCMWSLEVINCSFTLFSKAGSWNEIIAPNYGYFGS